MNAKNWGSNSAGSGNRGATTFFEMSMNLTSRQIWTTDRVFQSWENGPFSHLSSLKIPDHSTPRSFNFVARGRHFSNLLSVSAHFDSLTGISGRKQNHDPIVVDLVTSGSLEFTGDGGKLVVGPGQLCIRDTKIPWRFSCDPATRVRIVNIPRTALIPLVNSARVLDRGYIEDAHSPKARFLLHFLEAMEKSGGDLDMSEGAQTMALDACATLVAGMVSDRSNSGLTDHQQAIVRAAKGAVERNIEKRDLSPEIIARILGVSPRTLHRSFSASDDSIMAFARRRRLQKAHDDLLRSGNTVGVSEIAARWHFSDASHFIRAFKSTYGITPAAYLRNNTSKPMP
ncbi:AraC family transcriptional regulator [Streptomyces sp. NPDC046984]|uniref:AraC family transcriptional regulator n=1 Tax=Streptomyces sp. NPDC046984 TaxID=3155138 RepID=UPI003402CDE4